MNGTLKKVLTLCVLPLLIVLLVYLIISGVQKPVNFDKAKDQRSVVGIQRLKDIRELQVAYMSVNNKFASTIDSLILFYNEGKMEVILQVGSRDDSLAVVNTDRIRKKNRKITQQQLYDLYLKGERVIATITTKIDVKDTLFNHRNDFVVDSLKYIPFSGGQEVEMEAIVKKVSGVDVPLFEARMPYDALLKGLDRQLIINLKADCEVMNRYKGLQVGSVTAPNNNAGNWE